MHSSPRGSWLGRETTDRSARKAAAASRSRAGSTAAAARVKALRDGRDSRCERAGAHPATLLAESDAIRARPSPEPALEAQAGVLPAQAEVNRRRKSPGLIAVTSLIRRRTEPLSADPCHGRAPDATGRTAGGRVAATWSPQAATRQAPPKHCRRAATAGWRAKAPARFRSAPIRHATVRARGTALPAPLAASAIRRDAFPAMTSWPASRATLLALP